MKLLIGLPKIVLPFLIGYNNLLFSANFIPANHPDIQYLGRWDMTDPLQPKHSWAGVYIHVDFTGTSIGVRMADNDNYYNVYIDGKFHNIFHGNQPGETDYVLADSLINGRHTLVFSKRNCAQNKVYSFSGFLLNDDGELLLPPPRPSRKIEFIGDSFTIAEGNEATEFNMPWEETFPVSNIDKGFAPIIARHFNAQYHITARSGIGMVCDWTGDRTLNLPDRFNQALMDAPEPKWDLQQWIPNLVVICLGLNDHSGLKDKEGNVSSENSSLYQKRYHDFVATIRSVYPGVKILAVAAHVDWIRENVRQIVDEEKANGKQDIYYAQFDYFRNGYVANGHPSVGAHQKIAEQLIKMIETINLFK